MTTAHMIARLPADNEAKAFVARLLNEGNWIFTSRETRTIQLMPAGGAVLDPVPASLDMIHLIDTLELDTVQSRMLSFQ